MDTSKGVPLKITPDCLVDAIMELQISTEYKAEKVEQEILESIKNSFPKTTFRRFPLSGPDMGKHVWADKVFRVYVGESAISVNIVSGYPGWDNYMGFLKGAMQGLYSDTVQIVQFQKVRINYVSHFPDVSIFDVWDGTPIKLNHIPPFVGREFNFKFGIYHNDQKGESGQHVANAEVHLSDNLPIMDSKSTYSRIDVGLESTDCDGNWTGAYEKLQMLHFHEKDIFFRLLSEDFVNKLHPVWQK